MRVGSRLFAPLTDADVDGVTTDDHLSSSVNMSPTPPPYNRATPPDDWYGPVRASDRKRRLSSSSASTPYYLRPAGQIQPSLMQLQPQHAESSIIQKSVNLAKSAYSILSSWMGSSEDTINQNRYQTASNTDSPKFYDVTSPAPLTRRPYEFGSTYRQSTSPERRTTVTFQEPLATSVSANVSASVSASVDASDSAIKTIFPTEKPTTSGMIITEKPSTTFSLPSQQLPTSAPKTLGFSRAFALEETSKTVEEPRLKRRQVEPVASATAVPGTEARTMTQLTPRLNVVKFVQKNILQPSAAEEQEMFARRKRGVLGGSLRRMMQTKKSPVCRWADYDQASAAQAAVDKEEAALTSLSQSVTASQDDTIGIPAASQPVEPLFSVTKPTASQPEPLFSVTKPTTSQSVEPLFLMTKPTASQPVESLFSMTKPTASQPVESLFSMSKPTIPAETIPKSIFGSGGSDTSAVKSTPKPASNDTKTTEAIATKSFQLGETSAKPAADFSSMFLKPTVTASSAPQITPTVEAAPTIQAIPASPAAEAAPKAPAAPMASATQAAQATPAAPVAQTTTAKTATPWWQANVGKPPMVEIETDSFAENAEDEVSVAAVAPGTEKPANTFAVTLPATGRSAPIAPSSGTNVIAALEKKSEEQPSHGGLGSLFGPILTQQIKRKSDLDTPKPSATPTTSSVASSTVSIFGNGQPLFGNQDKQQPATSIFANQGKTQAPTSIFGGQEPTSLFGAQNKSQTSSSIFASPDKAKPLFEMNFGLPSHTAASGTTGAATPAPIASLIPTTTTTSSDSSSKQFQSLFLPSAPVQAGYAKPGDATAPVPVFGGQAPAAASGPATGSIFGFNLGSGGAFGSGLGQQQTTMSTTSLFQNPSMQQQQQSQGQQPHSAFPFGAMSQTPPPPTSMGFASAFGSASQQPNSSISAFGEPSPPVTNEATDGNVFAPPGGIFKIKRKLKPGN